VAPSIVTFLPVVRGQAHAKSTLSRALERGRLAPALVISGPPGVGRSLFAAELAKALVCRGEETLRGASSPSAHSPPPPARPCGACVACRKVDARSHPDVHWVLPDEDKASLTVPIERVRAALEEMSLAPVEAGRRVFVFDPADAMLEESMNAILKALEEPPPRVQILLVAAREAALLDTIGSRCQVVVLEPLAVEDVRAILVERKVAPAELDRRAAWSNGSPGRALEGDLLACAEGAVRALQAFASGGALRDPIGTAADLIEAAGGKGGEAKERRLRALLLLDCLALGLRDALVSRVQGGGTRLSGADRTLLERLASAASSEALARAIEAVELAATAIEENKHTTLTLEGLAIELGAALGSNEAQSARR
jgi:DNA polymerase-3 subunit delta'